MRRLLPARRPPSIKGVAVALLMAGLVVWIVGGLWQVRLSTDTKSFLPAGDPTVTKLQQQADQFGGDPIVVLLHTRQDEHTPGIQNLITNQEQLLELLHFEGEVATLHHVAIVYGPGTLLNQIAIAGQEFLSKLAGRRTAIQEYAEQQAQAAGDSPAAVTAAGQAAQTAFDDRYAPLLVQALPAGLPTLSNSNFVQEVVFSRPGVPRPEWHFVVPTASTDAVLIRPDTILDQSQATTLVASIRRYLRAAKLDTSAVQITGVPVVVSSLGTQVEHELPLIAGIVALAVLLRYLLVPSQLPRRHRFWPLLATIIGTATVMAAYGWIDHPLSLAAAAVLPLFIGVGSTFPLYLLTLRNRKRALVMAVSSAAGFASLALSPFPVVRELGVALAAGVLVTIPVALAAKIPRHAPTDPGPAPPPPRSRPARLSVLAALSAVAALGWVALATFHVAANPETLARGSSALQTANEVQDVIGYSGEIDVSLQGNNVLSPAALVWQRRAQAAETARYPDQVRPVLTLPNLLAFLGGTPTASEISSGAQLLPGYLTSGVLLPGDSKTILVFGAKLSGLAPSTISGIRQALPPPPPGYHAQLVGLPVATDRGYALISSERYLDNLLGVVASGIVLAVGLRRRRDALRAVLATLLATGWALVGVWALGWTLNPLNVTLGSLTAAAAGEFVVLLSEARHHRVRWLPRSTAIAAGTTVLGYLALSASQLTVLREFGIVLGASVLLSFLSARAVIFLLPDGPGPSAPARDPRRPVVRQAA